MRCGQILVHIKTLDPPHFCVDFDIALSTAQVYHATHVRNDKMQAYELSRLNAFQSEYDGCFFFFAPANGYTLAFFIATTTTLSHQGRVHFFVAPETYDLMAESQTQRRRQKSIKDQVNKRE